MKPVCRSIIMKSIQPVANGQCMVRHKGYAPNRGIFVGIHDDGQTIKISACYTSFILFYESCLIPMYKTQIYPNFQF